MDQNYIINNIFKSAAMAIKAGASALAKTTVAVLYKISGVIYPALRAGDLPALTGHDLADGFSMALLVQVDADATVTYKASSAVANVSGQVFKTVNLPSPDKNQAVVGYIVIENATGATFTGGTTALDAGGLTVEYIDAFGWVGA